MGRYTSPNSEMMMGYVHDTTVGTASTTSMARYFPITILPDESGRAYSSWSVCCRRSSAKQRMVSSGTAMRYTNVSPESTYSKLPYP